jgi:predicted amidohydrolase
MELSVVQFCPKLEDKASNISLIHRYLDRIESDIIVFPELATSGYFFNKKEEVLPYAVPFLSDEIAEFQSRAIDKNSTIVVGFAELDGDKIYNSAAVLMPDKSLSRVYRKTHLFFRERFCFEEGDTGFFVIKDKDRDINIGTMICYDWRFPEAARSLGLLGADLIVCPSNLVTDVWHLAMPARALENKVYLAVANRTGIETRDDDELVFKGESGIWSYNGKMITKAGFEDECVITCQIDPEQTRNKAFNPYNDIFTDRRPERYKF